jgi:hypothetical protein
LLKGLFVEVELRGRPRVDRLVIPRVALHGDRVYLVDKDNRLEKRAIEVGLLESEFLTVSAGLQAGEQVVISDLAPAIDGMLLAPVLDQDAQARLIREAQAGEAPQ